MGARCLAALLPWTRFDPKEWSNEVYMSSVSDNENGLHVGSGSEESGS